MKILSTYTIKRKPNTLSEPALIYTTHLGPTSVKKIRRQFEEWMPLVAYMIGPGGARCRDRFRAHESLVKVIRLWGKVKLDLMPKMSQSDISEPWRSWKTGLAARSSADRLRAPVRSLDD